MPAAIDRALPRLCSEAIGSAGLELMRSQVVAGRTERMLEILPQMAYVTPTPFLGARPALERVEEKVASLRRRLSERSAARPAAG